MAAAAAAHRRGGAGDRGDGGADLERLARQGRWAVADRSSTTAGRRRRAGSGARPTRAPRSKRRRAPGGWSRWRRRRKAAWSSPRSTRRAARIACARSRPFLTRRSAWRRCRRSPISSPPIRRLKSSGSPTGSNSAARPLSPARSPTPRAVTSSRSCSTRRRRSASPAPTIYAGALQAHLTRAGADGRRAGTVRALDAQGRSIGEASFDFGLGRATDAKFDLPVELRNQIARLVVADEASAGATWLVDERSRRRRVAILSGASADVAQPLLSPAYYIKRALAPYAEIREGGAAGGDTIEALLAEKPSVLALADMSVPPGPAHDKLAAFVESGGVLLRFAGTRLAAGDDDLTPTALRRGGRTLGGALSWETPKHIAAFDKESPFFGLAAPDEVTVSRQVLAEPEPGLAGKTWARLADGTPLVTAAPRGKGLIVLFHVTADTTWSNLPLSGLFVDMLRRIVARAGPAPAESSAAEKAGDRGDARALSHPRRLRRARGPAGRSRADRRRFRRPRRRAPSARLLRPRRRARSGQRLGAGRGARARRLRRRDDRRRRPRRRRAARPQAVAAARRLHRLPRRRPRQPVARPPAALRPPGRRGAHRHRRAGRGGDPRAAGARGRRADFGPRRRRRAPDPSRLRRDRRRDGRRDHAPRPRDAGAGARRAHVGPDRRPDRRRSGARRPELLSAALLADRRRTAAAAARRGRAHRRRS